MFQKFSEKQDCSWDSVCLYDDHLLNTENFRSSLREKAVRDNNDLCNRVVPFSYCDT